MKKIDKLYKADKGKVWQFTSVCESWASYKGMMGKIYDDNYVPCDWVDNYELVIEVNDPEYVEMPGYRAVYDLHGDGKYIFDTCNPVVYPFREMAQAAVDEFNGRPWNDQKAYIIDAIYKGKRPKATGIFEGKTVHNRDTFMYSYPIGTFVDEDVVDDVINALPPACMRSDCLQLGEPSGTRIDENGNGRFTYATFKQIAKDVWEYCGNCFKGENIQRGKDPVYV